MPYHFELRRDKRGKFRFNFKAPNGRIMFSSQGYVSKSSAMKTIESLKQHVGPALVEAAPVEPSRRLPASSSVTSATSPPHPHQDHRKDTLQVTVKKGYGGAKGLITMTADFDDPLDVFDIT